MICNCFNFEINSVDQGMCIKCTTNLYDRQTKKKNRLLTKLISRAKFEI